MEFKTALNYNPVTRQIPMAHAAGMWQQNVIHKNISNTLNGTR